MQPSDRRKFTVLIRALASAFGKTPEPAMLEGYWMGLDDLPLEGLKRACARAARQCTFMPKPVELRQMLGHLSPETRSLKAWDAVIGAIPAVGGYQSVQFSDALTNASVRLAGGWPMLCRMGERELGFARRNFESHYRALLEAPPRAEDCRHVPGVSELGNLANGQPAAEPVQVACDLPLLKVAPALASAPAPVVTLKPKRLGDDQ